MKSFDVAAVVSGGASGLGEATTRALAARGAAVTILDVQEEKGQALAGELGGHTTFVRTDVTDPASVQAAVEEATGKDRPLRIAINCAGIGWAQRTVGRGNEPHDFDAFLKVVQVNLSGIGIRVCTIAPGLVDTPLLGSLPEEARAALSAGIPFPKRLGRPADFAPLALDIVEHGYLNGEVIRMDGAMRMAPR